MNKWIMVSALIICLATAVHAEEKGMTKDQYVKQTKKWSEHPTKGFKFDQAKAEEKFDKLDADGDGLLTVEEREAGSKNTKKANKPKEDKEDKKGEKSDVVTKNEWVKKRMEWARKDPKWNPSKEKLEAQFDKLDKNGDGKLTPDEQE